MWAQVAFLAVEDAAHCVRGGPVCFGERRRIDFVPLVASLADRHGHDSRPLMGF